MVSLRSDSHSTTNSITCRSCSWFLESYIVYICSTVSSLNSRRLMRPSILIFFQSHILNIKFRAIGQFRAFFFILLFPPFTFSGVHTWCPQLTICNTEPLIKHIKQFSFQDFHLVVYILHTDRLQIKLVTYSLYNQTIWGLLVRPS